MSPHTLGGTLGSSSNPPPCEEAADCQGPVHCGRDQPRPHRPSSRAGQGPSLTSEPGSPPEEPSRASPLLPAGTGRQDRRPPHRFALGVDLSRCADRSGAARARAGRPEAAAVAMAAACGRLLPRSAAAGLAGLAAAAAARPALPGSEDRPYPLSPACPAPSSCPRPGSGCPRPSPAPQGAAGCLPRERARVGVPPVRGGPGRPGGGGNWNPDCWGQFDLKTQVFLKILSFYRVLFFLKLSN